jgi:uncharacterized protein YndB with AHSA1/START domain
VTSTEVHKDYDQLAVTLVTDFDAPVEQVWGLWSDARKLERWWGPPGFPATFEQHDLRSGGTVTYFMTDQQGDRHRGLWQVTLVDPPTRLEFRDVYVDAAGRPMPDMPVSRVSVHLVERGSGTRMELRSQFDSREDLEKWLSTNTLEGQQQAIGQMRDLLTTGSAPHGRGGQSGDNLGTG